MLSRFATWPDVVQYVRSNRILYYVPNDSLGPSLVFARPRLNGGDGVSIWLRSPDMVLTPESPSVVADATYLDKLYRWEVHKSDPT
jgi:hypothetical protein